jgi:hypothetical protein
VADREDAHPRALRDLACRQQTLRNTRCLSHTPRIGEKVSLPCGDVDGPRPQPFFVGRNQTDFTFTCPDCVHEKNSPFHPERAPFGTGSLADEEVQFGGSLPLDKDADWFTCVHGHRQFVVRRGTEQAARLGG